MIRVLIAAIVGVGLAACGSSAGYDQPVDDDRFDLLSFNMPPLLRKDAEKCVKTMNFVRGQGVKKDDELLSILLDFWQVVDVSYLSGEGVKSVIPSGGNPDDVATILPEGISLPTTIAHDCGLYAGGVVVKIGLLSLADSVNAAVASDPDVFENMGASLEQVQAGLTVMNAKSDGLRGLSAEDMVACTAIYQAVSLSKPSVVPLANIWMKAFVDGIESGRLDSANIREQSEYWNVLALEGPEAVISVDGYRTQASKCDGWVNESIEKQAASQ